MNESHHGSQKASQNLQCLKMLSGHHFLDGHYALDFKGWSEAPAS